MSHQKCTICYTGLIKYFEPDNHPFILSDVSHTHKPLQALMCMPDYWHL